MSFPVPSASSGNDTGQLFRELRRHLRLSLPDLARRLETRVDVIQALELGDLDRLPPWPETVRVISAYTLLAKIDPRPVLHLISARISAEGKTDKTRTREPRPEASLALPAQRTARPSAAGTAGAARISNFLAKLRSSIPATGLTLWPTGTSRPAVRWAAIAAFIAALAFSVVPSRMLQASTAGGSDPVSRMIGSLTEFMLQRSAPVRDGLKWIEVKDPRARKSDKLRTSKR